MSDQSGKEGEQGAHNLAKQPDSKIPEASQPGEKQVDNLHGSQEGESTNEASILAHALDPLEVLASPLEREKLLYVLSTIGRAQDAITAAFPQLGGDYPYKAFMKVDPTLKKPHASFLNYRGVKVIVLESPTDYTSDGFGDEVVASPFSEETQYKRDIVSLYAMLHEVGGHLTYDHITNPDNLPTTPDYYNTIDAAVSEGFAVMTELAVVDKIINGTVPGFTAEERAALSQLRAERLNSSYLTGLHANENAYGEGHTIMQNVYEKGGMDGALDFIGQLDSYKTRGVSRGVPHYRQSLITGDSEEFLGFFQKPSDEEV